MVTVATKEQRTRHEQMFPVLGAGDIERLRRFGELRRYAANSRLFGAGELAPGLILVLAGTIEITQNDKVCSGATIVAHGPYQFAGELAQLSDRPSLVNADALDAVEALVIAPQRLRDLLVQEAELGELIMRALILRRVELLELGVGGPIIIGHSNQSDVIRLQGFLRRNGQPHRVLDAGADSCAITLVERFAIDRHHLPIVLCTNGKVLRNPGEAELARCIGLTRPIDPAKVYDVAIVGAGPAGLAASVYAGSEGLSVITLDCRAFGGQAGASARIENYLGFPTGISGLALMARAYNQAQKFGVEMVIPDEARLLTCESDGIDKPFVLRVGENDTVQARAIVVACGARYRRLDIANLADFEGSSVHYWASPIEAQLCANQEVALVGAGNSAGQAAVFLAGHARKVWLLARRELSETMSRYLIDRIAAQSNIEVLTRTEASALHGADGQLQSVTWTHRATNEATERPVRQLFLFIGAEPNTDWLASSGIALDEKGFVITGPTAGKGRHPLETSRAGVYAIGDVRCGSTKRVAAAVGEGAQVVAAIHARFSQLSVRQAV
ncbi:MAG: FAD-dependent oxidoreductase [Gammaproteobacteria bacterium]|nr:FAD-dependent oxidoreductase [Gammaproteobacteria bacterium]MCP5458323.1 FAD-dependent oxidoreductase [Gammaproteobacteria bacterium]